MHDAQIIFAVKQAESMTKLVNGFLKETQLQKGSAPLSAEKFLDMLEDH